jgi:hypothetical protein
MEKSMYHALRRAFLSSKVGFVFIVTFLCASLSHSSAQSQDITPPTLTALSFTPTTIDTSAGSAIVTVHFSATDDLSGVERVVLDFENPSQTTLLEGAIHFSPSNTSVSGTFDVTFPQFSETGTWTVRQLFIRDAVGNTTFYHATELAQLGFPASVVVVGQAEDVTPPVITVSATPKTLWPPNGRMVPVTISGTITDAGSGVNASTATYTVIDEYGLIQPSGHFTILDANGNYAFTIQLQASRNGNDQDGRHYTIIVSAQDNEGNQGSKSAVVTVPHDQR